MTGVNNVTPAVHLRSVDDQDVEMFFEHESDPESAVMAGFPSRDRERFMTHWAKVRGDDTVVLRTIVADGVVAGNIGSWSDNGQQWLGYWLGREFWGRGVATQALARLMDEVSIRPLYAHVVAHNAGSIRVLQKCGFRRDHGVEAHVADDGIQELTYVLNA